jgi:hypothetical protein
MDLSFNAPGLLEPQLAIGVGVGYQATNCLQIWLESSALGQFYQKPAQSCIGGVREILKASAWGSRTGSSPGMEYPKDSDMSKAPFQRTRFPRRRAIPCRWTFISRPACGWFMCCKPLCQNGHLFRGHSGNGLQEPAAVRYPLLAPSPFVAIVFHFEFDAGAIAGFARNAV